MFIYNANFMPDTKYHMKELLFYVIDDFVEG